MKYLLIVCQKH
jgi:tetratricopeptide (TPR) repeat protein